ncbi:hypothetical protein WAF17_10795 [Bernardetia sp. ABR2-2B]|uniref:hypothetical protein n=1 Tax=Bernardetia sp. ABR2-2B TaxID=3127472 RepID=UPI0030D11FF7
MSKKSKNEIQKLFTANTEKDAKASAVQAIAHGVCAVAGGAMGATIGKPSLLASFPIIFAGKYFDQDYVTSIGAGMAANVTSPKSVNGLEGVEGIKEAFNPKAALERLKGYAKEVQHAAYLGEAPQINSYSHYISDDDSDVYQLPSHEMSQLAQHMEGLAENLDDFDAYLEGEDEEDGIVLSDVLQGLRGNLNALRDTVHTHPELLEEGSFDEETMDAIEGLSGLIGGASMAGLNGHDDDFLDEVADGVGTLEGLLGIDDDEDEEDDDLEGFDEEDEFDIDEDAEDYDEAAYANHDEGIEGFDEEDEEDMYLEGTYDEEDIY